MKSANALLAKKQLLEIFVRYRVDSPYPGDWESIFKGSGYEFWALRELEATDSWQHIDWKATARTGRYYVREYLAESYFDLMLLYDMSKSVALGRKDDLQANIAVALAYSAVSSNNGCGLIMFADEVITYLPPQMGWPHFLQIVAAIAQAAPVQCRQTNLHAALTKLVTETPESLTFILSDFLYPCECGYNFQRTSAGTNKHEVTAIQVLEEWELALPPDSQGVLPLYDYESGTRTLLDLSKWQIYNDAMQNTIRQQQSLLQKAGIPLLTMTPADDFVQKINEFMLRRDRK